MTITAEIRYFIFLSGHWGIRCCLERIGNLGSLYSNNYPHIIYLFIHPYILLFSNSLLSMRVRSCVTGKQSVLRPLFWDLVLLKHRARFLLLSLVSSIVKGYIVFLAGLHAFARMTACYACFGVNFIAIPLSFLFLSVQAFARTSKNHTSSLAETRGRPGQFLSFTLSFNFTGLSK